jgi:two-component system alkaline phosphatase synthesis response regulator PhoP/two-component system response regulator ResD
VSSQTILIVDDEQNIIELARMYLEQAGFNVISAANGATALDLIFGQPPDFIVLDLMLPGVDGWEVCKRVRARSEVPILMLTARDDDVDKIVGLELGADDYMTKPFNPRELVARIRAILRRTGSAALPAEGQVAVRIGDLLIDPARREVSAGAAKIPLRVKEFDLLHTLALHPGIVLSREQLLEMVWGFDFYGQTRTVDVHVAHVRSKLAAAGSRANIETVWGVGYKLLAEG